MPPTSEQFVIVVEESDKFLFSWRKLWKFLGPGLLMSIAYVDPGNLESDLQTGATTGYSLLWLLLWCTLMGYVIQMQSAKLGVATGKHLAEHCRENYSKRASKLLWIMVEIAIIGSSIQEVVGSAIAISVLSRGAVPLWLGVLVSATSSFLLLLTERLGNRVLELIFAVMISVMIITFGWIHTDSEVPAWRVAKGFLVPNLKKESIHVAVGMVGSLIMPHNIYLYSALVKSRQLDAPTGRQKRDALVYFAIESAMSLTGAVFINMFVVTVFAKAFFGNPNRPDEVGLESAADYLKTMYGGAVVVIWGLGLLAAGQSSTMTGTYTGQFVMTGFLDMQISPVLRSIVTRLVALAPTLVIAVLYRDSHRLDQLNQGLNILQSIQLPFALIPVLSMTCDESIMGSFVTRGWELFGCGAIAAAVLAVNTAAVFEFIEELLEDAPIFGMVGIFAILLFYVVFVGYLIMKPARMLYQACWAWVKQRMMPSTPPSPPAAISASREGTPRNDERKKDLAVVELFGAGSHRTDASSSDSSWDLNGVKPGSANTSPRRSSLNTPSSNDCTTSRSDINSSSDLPHSLANSTT